MPVILRSDGADDTLVFSSAVFKPLPNAASGVKALEVWKEHRNEIRLLLTDMVMPDGMNGKELARRLLQETPGLKVIYTSGYSADIAGKDFPLEEGVNFLMKPFEVQKLAQTVRACLEETSAT